MSKTYGSRRKEIMEGWRTLKMLKLRRVGWAGHVVRRDGMKINKYL